MSDFQAVACFVIYSGEEIAYQGSFQVSEERSKFSYTLIDDGEFEFLHCHVGTQCEVKLTYLKGGSAQAQLDLEIPINRTKIKWKEAKLGANYEVRYRCVFELGENSKELRKMRRRSAIARIGRPPDATIYYRGNTNPDGDA